MPGFTTHYLFSMKTYRLLSNCKLKNILKNNVKAYTLGAQGPDIFFYNSINQMQKGCRQLGSYIHDNESGKFFENSIKNITCLPTTKEKEIAIAYLCGFLCHYILDYICHPYIYAKTNYDVYKYEPRNFGIHTTLETIIDAFMLEKIKSINPCQFEQSKTINLKKFDQRVVSKFLSKTINCTYKNEFKKIGYTVKPIFVSYTINGMKFKCKCLIDKNNRKVKFLDRLENKLFGYRFLSGMLIHDDVEDTCDCMNSEHKNWCNPWNKSIASNVSFYELFKIALVKSTEILELINKCELRYANVYDNNIKKLVMQIENHSYYSGLNIN